MKVTPTYAQERAPPVVQVHAVETAVGHLFVKREARGTYMVRSALVNGTAQLRITLCLHESQVTFNG